jgi:drug/metabolite transporter (DMT)-like permease
MIAVSFGMAAYTVNDAFVKLVAQELPIGEVLFLRSALSIGILIVVLGMTGGLRHLASAANPTVMLRSVFDALGTVCFIVALLHMKFADVSAVIMTSPLILTAYAALILGDRVGWRRWAAIAVGLAGTLFIVKPGPGAFDWWALVGLVAAFMSAGRDLTTRQVNPAIPSLAVALYGTIAVTLAGAAIGLTESWSVPSREQSGFIAISAVFLGIGTYLVIYAFRDVEVSAVAPFRYTLLLWTGIAGYVAFGELPDRWALFGAALIVLSGLYALHREAVVRRMTAAGPTPD